VPPLPPPRSRALRAAAVLAAGQGAVLVGYAAFLGVQDVQARDATTGQVATTPAGFSLGLGVLVMVVVLAGLGVGQVAVGHSLWRRRGRARTPFVVAQLLGVAIGATFTGPDGLPVPVATTVVATSLVGLVLAFSPPLTRELAGVAAPPGPG